MRALDTRDMKRTVASNGTRSALAPIRQALRGNRGPVFLGGIMSDQQPGQDREDPFRRFLVGLATNADQLGRFIKDPDGSMRDAGLSEGDRATLKSGNAATIYARLSGGPSATAPVTVVVVHLDPAAEDAKQKERLRVAIPQIQPAYPIQYVQYPVQYPVQPFPVHSMHCPVHSMHYPVHPMHFPVYPMQYPVHPMQYPVHPMQYPVHPLQSPVYPVHYPAATYPVHPVLPGYSMYPAQLIVASSSWGR